MIESKSSTPLKYSQQNHGGRSENRSLYQFLSVWLQNKHSYRCEKTRLKKKEYIIIHIIQYRQGCTLALLKTRHEIIPKKRKEKRTKLESRFQFVSDFVLKILKTVEIRPFSPSF